MEEEDLLRASGVAPALVEEERAVWLSPALFAKVGSRARRTVLSTVLTGATPRRGPCALGTGGNAGLSQQVCA